MEYTVEQKAKYAEYISNRNDLNKRLVLAKIGQLDVFPDGHFKKAHAAKPGKVFKDITGIHGVGNKSKLRKAVSYARDTIVREQLAAKRKDAISKLRNRQ